MQSTKAKMSKRGLAAAVGGLLLVATLLPESSDAVEFKEPDDAPPATTVSGGSRGGSSSTVLPLLPQSGHGYTKRARPTFLVYVSLGASTGQTAVFFIQDIERGVQSEATVPLSDRQGITTFELPASLPELEPDRPYQWFLVLTDAGETQPRVDAPFAGGVIERRSGAGHRAVSLDAAIAAGEEGRWYDAAGILATLRQDQPEDPVLSDHWTELLQSAQLESYLKLPLARSTKP